MDTRAINKLIANIAKEKGYEVISPRHGMHWSKELTKDGARILLERHRTSWRNEDEGHFFVTTNYPFKTSIKDTLVAESPNSLFGHFDDQKGWVRDEGFCYKLAQHIKNYEGVVDLYMKSINKEELTLVLNEIL